MSDASNPFEAYKPPPAAAAETPEASAITPKISGRTKAVCIIAIVLGGLGLMVALFSVAGLVLGETMQAMTAGMQDSQQSGANDPAMQMNAEIYKVQGKFIVFNVITVCLHFAVALLLLIGGIQCLRQSPFGLKLLPKVCGVAIVFELVRLTIQTIQQFQMMDVVGRNMSKMMNTSGDVPAGAENITMMAMKVGIVVGLVMGGGMVLAKIIYYAFAIIHLRKPEVRATLGAAQTPQ